MSGCVDKDSIIFEKFCNDYGVAPSHMELIIHSWWKTHSDGSFPDDTFINNYKYGESVEMSDNDILLAEERHYFGSKEFTNREEAVSYYKRLSSLYPKKAIGSYTDTTGKTIITLAKPIITSDLKYKNYNKPVVGSTIDTGEGIETISRVRRRTNTEWIVETEAGFRSITATDRGKFTKRDGTEVKVEGSVPYYNEYIQSNFSEGSPEPTTNKESHSTPTTINIYAGTGENAHLSNFAERPFTLEGINLNTPTGRDFSAGTIGIANGKYVTFNTVEGAFQAAKLMYQDNLSYTPEKYREVVARGEDAESIIEKLTKSSGAEARRIGRSLEELNTIDWDKDSSFIMKALIKASFEQNPIALNQLLDTGNAQLTHTQDRGKWGVEFPKLLMEVRDELRGQVDYLSIVSPIKRDLRKIDSLLDTLPKVDNEYFRNLDEAIEFLGTLSNYNPRLKALSDFLKRTKQEGKTLNKVEYDAIMSLLRETSLSMEESLEKYEKGTNDPTQLARIKQEQEQQQDMEQTINKNSLSEEDQKYVDECTALNTGLNNLLTSKALTATEAMDIADQMVNWISDLITAIQEGDKDTLAKYEQYLSNIDPATADRVTIARAIGANKLIEDCRDNFVTSQEDRDVSLRKLRVIKNNWSALMNLASATFMANEKFSIIGNGDNITIVEDDNIDADNINASNETSAIQEGEGNAQDHWQIESRTKDIVQNATALVRHTLRQCYIIDKDGNIDKTEFGINKRVKVQDAVKSILRWTQGAMDIDEMISALEAKEEGNPWIRQIIDKLQDRSGKEADFQSQFFTSFCLREQLYSVVKAERTDNGVVYKSIPVNKSPALKEATNAVINQFKAGEHPLFTSQGVNESAFKELSNTRDILMGKSEEVLDFDKVAKLFAFSFHTLGYYVAEEDVKEAMRDVKNQEAMRSALDNIVDAISRHMTDSNYQPFIYSTDKGTDSVYRDLRKLLKPVTDRLEDTAISSFYNDGKMYQTYTTPSYLTNLMAKFHKGSEADFEAFIQSQYGGSEWFKDQNGDLGSGWYTPWLAKMMRDSTGNMRKMLDHKVQLSFDSKAYMTQMSDLQYTLSILSEYFSMAVENGAIESPAWFRVPMLSNKTSSEYIKFYKYTGTKYKDSVALDMVDIMFQEIARIRTVNIRNLNKNDKGFIKNWDTKGKEFNLVSFLNSYLKEGDKKTEFGNLLRRATSKEGISESETETLATKAKKVIMDEMQQKANEVLSQYNRDGLIEAAESIENIGSSQEEIISNLENFIWNDTLAAMNILELTITDPAYYGDAVDLQKRFAQIHAPGTRPNVKATDYKGNSVSDEWSRTIVLNDFKGLTSNIIENLEIVFQRKIDSASTPAEKAMYEKMKKDIIAQFKDINVTDAQAYNSPTSYRKKAILFGRWGEEKEKIYQNLMKGEYTVTDLQKAFGEVLKPFVYTQTTEKVGMEGSPIQNIPVPFQNKNSEYLLIMADAILKGEDTGKPNLLRAIYEVMEDSAKANPLRGIDTVQFDSAVKSGLHDPINIGQFEGQTNGEKLAKEFILNSIYEPAKKADGTYERSTTYKPSVRLIEWMDYGIQQEVPQHFNTHFQAHGSQIRAITPSELSEGAEFMGMSREKFAAEYENTIAENIKESLDEIAKEFRLTGNRKERNIAISKILRRELNSSSRYGIDLKQACLINKDGEFNIPLGDPIQAKRIEQLINSVIKNNVNKQEIAGGPVVQVSNFGTSKSLNIRFKDRNGELLLTRDEYKGDDYEKYIRENQAGVAYLEVYAPIYANDLFERFADEKGNIDVAAIERLDPDLLKMVGYRIPTEDKYSCAPIKIVGFLPREAGDGIMLPAEITLLSGSDFDVDKIYLMRKESNIVEDKKKIHNELFNDLIKSQDNKPTYDTKNSLHELIDMFLSRPYDRNYLVNMTVADGYLSIPESAYSKLLKTYERLRRNPDNLKVVWPKEGRSYRNNKIVDMTYEVLTHEDSADKLLNPGGFEQQKKLGYIVSALRIFGDRYSYNELNGMSINELKKLSSIDQNLAFIDTHVQFYKQNSAAAVLIGMFAVSKVAHAILERDPLYIDFGKASKLGVPMKIGNVTLQNMTSIDPTRDSNQTLIGKTLGSLVASAADAAKDPVLNLMNVNKDTANILNTAIRLGIPFEDAALLLSQKCVANLLNSVNKDRLAGAPASIQGSIKDRLDNLKDKAGMKTKESTEKLLSEGLSKDELVYGIYKTTDELEIKALSFIQALLNINNELRELTLATRFNSISNAAGPLIVDNLIMENKLGNFSKFIYKYNKASDNFEKVNSIASIFEMHPMLDQFSKGFPMARTIMMEMPLYSMDFRDILDTIEAQKASNIMNGRENLSKFADFYVSYLLVENGVIDPNSCNYYINEFPRNFLFKNKYKEKYRGNALIDAIKLEIDSKTKMSTLKVDITGLDTEQKNRLMSGYIDLLSTDKKLAIELFKYNFFRGGLGFTPKTFMSLTPLLLKQSIEGYSDSFSGQVSSDPIEVINLFIRNNWKDSNFVKYLSPITEDKKPNFKINKDGVLTTVPDKSLYSRYESQGYIRTRVNNVEKLYKQVAANESNNTVSYVELKPLGNNKAYLEFTDTPISIEDNINTEDNSNGVVDIEPKEDDHVTPTTDMSDIQAAFELVMSPDAAKKKITEFKAKPVAEKKALEGSVKNFLAKQFTKLNIKFDENKLNEEFKKMC